MVRRLTASLLETWPKTLQNRTPCRSGLHRNAKFSTHAVVAERADGWRVGYFSDSSITDASLHTFENVPSSALTLVEHDGVQEHTGETQLHGQRVRKSNMFFQAKTPSVLGFEQTKEHVTLLHEKLAQAESVSPLHRHVRHITIDSPAARSRYNSTWRRLTRHINRQSPIFIGFDVQPRAAHCRVLRVSLAFEGFSFIWHVDKLGYVPTELDNALKRSEWIKVGFRVAHQMARLYRDCRAEASHICDLNDVATTVLGRSMSLQTLPALTRLASFVSGHKLPQSKGVEDNSLQRTDILVAHTCWSIVNRLWHADATFLQRCLRLFSSESVTLPKGRQTSQIITASFANSQLGKSCGYAQQRVSTVGASHVTTVESAETKVRYAHPTFNSLTNDLSANAKLQNTSPSTQLPS